VERPVSWVLGRGGLLGSPTERALARTCDVWVPGWRFAWEESSVTAQIQLAVRRFAEHVSGRRWRVAWCAGAGVVTSDESTLVRESAALGTLLTELGASIDQQRLDRGAFFLASSAGGVYAGSPEPPFDERTEPCPLSPYGRSKLVQEDMVARWSAQFGVPSLLGRIANLYGPGQNLAKPQGLISQLCWAQLKRQPLQIYVPLGTLRDYLYAPDCGELIASCLSELSGQLHGMAGTVKVMASQRPMSIGAVLGEFTMVLRRSPRTSLRASPLGQHQVSDLRLTSSSELGDTRRRGLTPFPVGLHATFQDLRHRCARTGSSQRSAIIAPR
jgi:UDP-glucose 4-epimerase